LVAQLNLQTALLSFPASPPPALSPLSLHDALPISRPSSRRRSAPPSARRRTRSSAHRPSRSAAEPCPPARSWCPAWRRPAPCTRSEEHTSELQSRENIVCRLLLEKKKQSLHTSYKR